MTFPIIFGLENFRPGQGRGGYTFSVAVQGDFLMRCSRHTRTPQEEKGINEMGAEIIHGALGQENRTPYIFHGNSLLIDQASLGNEGRYLSLNSSQFSVIRRAQSPIRPPATYEGHNIDSPQEAYTLLSLLTTWAEYAGALL